MRVLIDARMDPGSEGGLEPLTIGLANGFGRLAAECADEFVFLTRSGASSFLRPFVGGRVSVLEEPAPPAPARPTRLQSLKQALPWLAPLARKLGLRQPGRQPMELLRLPETAFASAFDVVHSLNPILPIADPRPLVSTVYDFQHRHLPELFSPEVVRWRETVHPQHYRSARRLVAISRFTAGELQQFHGVPAERVDVVYFGPPVAAYGTLAGTERAAVVKRWRLDEPFVLYPSLTYAHKNHLGLLEAVAWLRGQGRRVRVICTGAQKLAWPQIESRRRELGLEEDVAFTGFLPAAEMRAVFEHARGLVFPSRYEGLGLGLIEALNLGIPIACSELPVFREVAGEAAVFFDPAQPQAIARAIEAILDDAGLRERLTDAGRMQSRRFDWLDTARGYLAAYRAAFAAGPMAEGQGKAES